jgi:hypothetical protein
VTTFDEVDVTTHRRHARRPRWTAGGRSRASAQADSPGTGSQEEHVS